MRHQGNLRWRYPAIYSRIIPVDNIAVRARSSDGLYPPVQELAGGRCW